MSIPTDSHLPGRFGKKIILISPSNRLKCKGLQAPTRGRFMQLFAMQSVKSLTGENSCRNLPVSYCKLRRYKNAEVRKMKSKVAIVRAKPE
ncbi:hypothetical protein J7K99_05015, partial [bacterium]|nr:hypothetical protein [bacterium]